MKYTACTFTVCHVMKQGLQRTDFRKERKKKERYRQAESKAERQEQKVCPNCGRKMKQQFIGFAALQMRHKLEKDIGYFERTGDMVFALERRKAGKKTKQCPVIRYR